MIEAEIFEVIGDVNNGGDRLNEIVDQFRRGRDLSQVVDLLESSNSELVSIGAWILSELHFEQYNMPQFISRLRELINHEAPMVRFHALGALYPALDRDDAATRTLLDRMRRDPNEGVRERAQAAASRLSLK